MRRWLEHRLERARASGLPLFNCDVRCSMFDVKGFPTSPLRVGRSGEEGISRRLVGSPGWVVGIPRLGCESDRPDPIYQLGDRPETKTAHRFYG